MVNGRSTEHSFPSSPHTYGVFFLCGWIPQSLFSSASSLYPSPRPSDSSRRTSNACKQQQRTKAGSSHSLEPKTSSLSRQLNCFHTYPVTGGISFQAVRYNLISQNMQHILKAKEISESFLSWAAIPADEGIIEHTAKFFAWLLKS